MQNTILSKNTVGKLITSCSARMMILITFQPSISKHPKAGKKMQKSFLSELFQKFSSSVERILIPKCFPRNIHFCSSCKSFLVLKVEMNTASKVLSYDEKFCLIKLVANSIFEIFYFCHTYRLSFIRKKREKSPVY